MAKQDDKNTETIQNLETIISELQRVYDWLTAAYQQAKVRVLTFLGGGLAVMTFLYADGDTFIPKETYGQIIYFGAVGLVIGSLLLLFTALLSRRWEFTLESRDLPKLEEKTRLEYLKYLKKQYISAYEANSRTYEIVHKYLNRAFLPLLSGAILLIVLKIFGTEKGGELCQLLMERL